MASSLTIIGGGFIGLACAWKLQEAGFAVRLLEKESLGAGASLASLGALWAPSPTKRSPFRHFHRQSLVAFPSFVAELEEYSGISVDYRICGGLESIPTPHQYDQALREIEAANESSTDPTQTLELLSQAQAKELEPEVAWDDFGALYSPHTAQLQVAALISALEKSCRQAEVVIHEKTHVQAIERTSTSTVVIKTDKEQFSSDLLLLCTGAWTSQIDPHIAEETAITPVRGQALLLQCNSSLVKHIIRRRKIYFIPEQHSCLTLGSTTEPDAGWDSSPTSEGLDELLTGGKAFLPSVAHAAVSRHWAGLRPRTASRKPILSRSLSAENIFIAAGHYKIGLGMIPFTTDIMVNLLTKNIPAPDIFQLKER